MRSPFFVFGRYVSDPETKYKCSEQSDGTWFCERLDKIIANPKRRFIMTVRARYRTVPRGTLFFFLLSRALLPRAWTCDCHHDCHRDCVACWLRRRKVSVKDHSGSQLVSLFDDQASQLLGHSADEIHEMQQSGDHATAEMVYKRALFMEGLFSLKVKTETYNDEARVKVVCNAMQAINFAEESKQLIDAINAFV